MSPAELNQLVEHIATLVRGGLTPGQAAERLAQIGVDAQLVEQAAERFRELTGRVRILREPRAVFNGELRPWYSGPSENDRFWPAYLELLESKGRAIEEIDSVNRASTKVISFLEPPGSNLISTRGLVVGYIQSGKTENFTAVIAKAADAGYRLFIILSGITNALRNQTQRRLQREIVDPNSENWFTLTSPTRDFREDRNVDVLLAGDVAVRIIGVIKKNASRLRRLRDWLLNARPEVLRNCPILLIDDEADQASPNAAREAEQRTVINGVLVELLRSLPKAAYVGYTATPFANLLIDPSTPADLYPKDFIVDLPRPSGYFGPERIFGRGVVGWDDADEGADGLDMIRIVPNEEITLLMPSGPAARDAFQPAVTPSLGQALRYFWMVTAARRRRTESIQHSTMLVHTSLYQIVHERFQRPIEEYRDAVATRLRARDADLERELQSLWEREQLRVPAGTLGHAPVSFEQLLPHLQQSVTDTHVKIENARSANRINYEEGGPQNYIIIGGNVLSRGLTLEGLSVSFFIRTASAYDTLLQMGRWFGFRRGYEDLPRMWMTDELRGFFFDLATVDREIRFDMERYETGLVSPLEFGVRIRQHPVLAITSQLKMRHAVQAAMSFADQTKQTTIFKHTDNTWLDQNARFARDLIRRINEAGIAARQIQDRPHYIFFDVPSTVVSQFIADYQIHEAHVDMRSDLLMGYIRSQNERGHLRNWNVGIVSRRPNAELGMIALGLAREVQMVNRARFIRGDLQHATIKALVSEIDEALDVNLPTDELRGLSRQALTDARRRAFPSHGLLLLYPISRNSRPTGTANEQRRPLNAVADVIGIALIFPATNEDTPQGYMTVDLSRVPREELDVEELDDDDEVFD